MARNSRSESSATMMAGSGGGPSAPSSSTAVMAGYLLKKKRKRIQGMAKRYFSLSSSGQLSYSFHPNGPVRDSVLVSQAFIHASRKERAFHIDSGNTVMHCKALSEADFDRWTDALRTFIGGVVQESAARGGRVASMGGVVDEPDPVDLSTILGAVDGLSKPISELEAMERELKEHEATLHPSPALVSTSPSQKLNKFLKKGSVKGGYSDDYFDSKSGHASPPDPVQLLKQLSSAIDALRKQQALVAVLLKSSIPRVSSPASVSSGAAGQNYGANIGKQYASRTSASYPIAPSRASTISLAASEDTEEFYEDAPTGGEFFLEEEQERSDDEPLSGSDEEDFFPEMEEFTEEKDDSYQREEKARTERVRRKTLIGEVRRRKVLPAPVSGDEFSMLSMLRKNVGKDLSTISFPVTFNEPLSALQRIAEELEYTDLLHKAAKVEGVERMVLVAAFAISGSSGNKFRSSRKPFNPLLGETYECVRPDKGFKFISEKVSHHPPVMAFHASSELDTEIVPAWEINGHIAPSQKFWGRSFELMFPGNFSVTFADTGETFSVIKPSSFVRNLVAGTKYLEIVGEMIITSSLTPMRAVINFKEGSSWGGSGSRNKIEGRILDGNGELVVELTGRWDEQIDRKKGERDFERVWSVNEFPKNPEMYYGFSNFSTELNETTFIEEGFLPTSDSRLRPDQLALERGDVDEAEITKIRVEEKQREKRKSEAARGGHKAQHFREIAGGKGWEFAGDYFTKRADKTLVDVDIF